MMSSLFMQTGLYVHDCMLCNVEPPLVSIQSIDQTQITVKGPIVQI